MEGVRERGKEGGRREREREVSRDRGREGGRLWLHTSSYWVSPFSQVVHVPNISSVMAAVSTSTVNHHRE